VELDALWLAVAFFLIALIYASVGQAGASGYIAIMALLGFAPLAMKTTALALNLLVAAIGTAMFLKAGRLSWRSMWPFAVLGSHSLCSAALSSYRRISITHSSAWFSSCRPLRWRGRPFVDLEHLRTCQPVRRSSRRWPRVRSSASYPARQGPEGVYFLRR
jgi:hypothetical protein